MSQPLIPTGERSGLQTLTAFLEYRFRRFKHFNEIIFIGDFASPWWWDPWWGWNWGYPYGSYGYSYPSDYSGYGYGYGNYGYGYGSSGYDYGYGYPSGSYYGSYYSGTNYANDDENAVRNVLAKYAVAWNRHDMAAFGRFFTENCDYVNIAGVHWKGVQEIVQRQAELFQSRLKTAVRTLTHMIETHEHKGDFREWWGFARITSQFPLKEPNAPIQQTTMKTNSIIDTGGHCDGVQCVSLRRWWPSDDSSGLSDADKIFRSTA